MNPDTYFQRPEVSNSDLSWLKSQLFPREMPDPTTAYRFGNLLDAMITEPNRVNYFKRTCDSDQFTKEDFDTALRMKEAFWNDGFCSTVMSGANPQKVMVDKKVLNFNGLEFDMGVRCKWDIWRENLGYGGDIKSTSATTQKQFEDAIRFFDYPRQRAWYMDIANSDKDFLIGISKKNFKVFKVIINRGDSIYNEGFADYINLAYRHFLLFGSYKRNANAYKHINA